MREHGDDAGDHTGYLAMKRLLELNPRPDGVFCYNDPTAMGAMKAVLDAGLNVPNDVAIVGCGNVTYADFIRVPLTSVDQQSDQIGERAAKLALSVLEHPPSRPKQVVLQPSLVERASTQGRRAGNANGQARSPGTFQNVNVTEPCISRRRAIGGIVRASRDLDYLPSESDSERLSR